MKTRLSKDELWKTVKELKQEISSLKDQIRLQNEPTFLTTNEDKFNLLLDVVSKYTGVLVEYLKSSKRISNTIAEYRHIFVYLAKKHISTSYSEIGRFLGGRDHSTAIHSFSQCLNLSDKHKDYEQLRNAIEKEFLERQYNSSNPTVDEGTSVERIESDATGN